MSGRTTAPAPRIVVALAVVAIAAFALPVAGLVWEAPWRSTWREVTSSPARDALFLSLVTSLLATAVAVVLGTPLAWLQARRAYPGRRLVRTLTALPMVLPPVVGGTALLLALGRRGLVGGALARAGVELPFHLPGAVLAETFVAMPFFVLTVEAALRTVDPDVEDAARTLGATPWRVFWSVTLPLVRPSLVAGAVLCWARALGEFGATITFAGNLAGHTQTLPLFVYVKLESGQPDAAIALSLVLLAVSVAVLFGLRERWLRVP